MCGEPVPPQPGAGRPSVYCSSRCKSLASRLRRKQRELAAQPAAKTTEIRPSTTQPSQARSMARDAAIELVAADPSATLAVLMQSKSMILAPTHRASRWSEVSSMIRTMAALLPDD